MNVFGNLLSRIVGMRSGITKDERPSTSSSASTEVSNLQSDNDDHTTSKTSQEKRVRYSIQFSFVERFSVFGGTRNNVNFYIAEDIEESTDMGDGSQQMDNLNVVEMKKGLFTRPNSPKTRDSKFVPCARRNLIKKSKGTAHSDLPEPPLTREQRSGKRHSRIRRPKLFSRR